MIPPAPQTEPSPQPVLDVDRLLTQPTVATWTIAVIAIVVSALVLGVADETARDGHLLALGLFPDQVAQGQLWRLITGPWLHQSWAHLGVNVVALIFAGRLVEGLVGPVWLWLIYAAGALGGAVGTIASGVTASVGASGAVFGLLGALLVIGLRYRKHLAGRSWRVFIAVPTAALVTAMVVELIEPGHGLTDVGAHTAGTFVGGVAGWLGCHQVAARFDIAGLGRVVPANGSLVARAAAVGLALVHVGAGGAALTAPSDRISVSPPRVEVLRFEDTRLPVPVTYPIGVWRKNRCEGTMTPVVWALKTARTPCFRLPLGGVLLLGRRDKLLTLDTGDEEAMRRAAATKRFVHRQPQVMLFPLGKDLLYALFAPEAVHDAYNEAFAGLLAEAGPATIAPARQQGPAIVRPADKP